MGELEIIKKSLSGEIQTTYALLSRLTKCNNILKDMGVGCSNESETVANKPPGIIEELKTEINYLSRCNGQLEDEIRRLERITGE